MRNYMAIAMGILLIGGSALGAGPVSGGGPGPNPNGQQTLSPEATAALITALTGPSGEYAAHARYHAILDKFGEVQPFVRIVEAEQRHIDALVRQCTKYGVPIPADTYLGNVTAPDTLLQAASEAASAEILNAAMYEALLPEVAAYPSLTSVFLTLQEASLENHLPAFLKLVGKLD